MELDELNEDSLIKEKLQNLDDSVKKIQKVLDLALQVETEKLPTIKDKVDFDLFLMYTLNTLYWMYLRTKGEDPGAHDVKNQLNRIKEYMVKAKQAHERQTIRPKIDQPAAQRFVKHGINYKNKRKVCDNELPLNKKQKFDD